MAESVLGFTDYKMHHQQDFTYLKVPLIYDRQCQVVFYQLIWEVSGAVNKRNLRLSDFNFAEMQLRHHWAKAPCDYILCLGLAVPVFDY